MNRIPTVELCQRAELEWKLKHRNIQTSVLLRKPLKPSDKVCLVSIGTVKKTSKRSKFQLVKPKRTSLPPFKSSYAPAGGQPLPETKEEKRREEKLSLLWVASLGESVLHRCGLLWECSHSLHSVGPGRLRRVSWCYRGLRRRALAEDDLHYIVPGDVELVQAQPVRQRPT